MINHDKPVNLTCRMLVNLSQLAQDSSELLKAAMESSDMPQWKGWTWSNGNYRDKAGNRCHLAGRVDSVDVKPYPHQDGCTIWL